MAPQQLVCVCSPGINSRRGPESVKPFALKGCMTTAAVNGKRLDDRKVTRCPRLEQAATYSAAAIQNSLILFL